MIINKICVVLMFKEQINIKEQLPKYLVSEVKLLTTKCVLMETEKIAKKTLGALTILKQFGIHKCGHTESINGADCLLSMIGRKNEGHYIVATQDRSLQDRLRTIPGTPIMYLHLKAPTLEKPSEASTRVADKKTQQLMSVSNTQANTLTALKQESGLSTIEVVNTKRKKRKGGPNPLSCLKKKKIGGNSDQKKISSNQNGKIKKRKRVRLPAHVKASLKS